MRKWKWNAALFLFRSQDYGAKKFLSVPEYSVSYLSQNTGRLWYHLVVEMFGFCKGMSWKCSISSVRYVRLKIHRCNWAPNWRTARRREDILFSKGYEDEGLFSNLNQFLTPITVVTVSVANVASSVYIVAFSCTRDHENSPIILKTRRFEPLAIEVYSVEHCLVFSSWHSIYNHIFASSLPCDGTTDNQSTKAKQHSQ